MKPLFLLYPAVALGIAITALLAAAATPSPAPSDEVDRTKQPAAGPLPAINIPDAITETLPNGLRVYILPSHRQPTVTYQLLIKSGETYDGAKPGMVELTADLLNKGTEKLTADEFARKTDFLGASVEASSSDDSVTIKARGLSKYTGELLEFLRDAALRPAFREDELNQEKLNTVSNLVEKKSNPHELAARIRNKLLYGKHPYGAYPTPQSVQSITRDDLIQFHNEHFLPNNATLVVVGDVDPADVLARIKGVFGDWKRGDVPKGESPAFPEIKGISIHLVDRPGSVQSDIIVAGRGIPRNNPDAPEISVVNSVLGGGFSGRLFANLREKHAFTYGAYSGFSEKKQGGAFSATAEVRNAVTAPAVTEILNELKRITADPIPEPELNLQRNYLAGNFLLSLESNERTAERLQEIDLFGLPEDFYKTYAQRLTSVTPEKASALAKKYIDPKNLVIVVVGEAKEVLPELQKLGDVTVYDTDMKERSKAPMKGDAGTPAPTDQSKSVVK